MEGPKIVELAQSLAEKIKQSRSKDNSEEFDEIMGELGDFLGNYENLPTDPVLISRCFSLVERLEGIANKKIESVTTNRSAVNSAIASARMKRTHYAAYIAGKSADSEFIGDKFKCWIHNAAANGATSLGECIDSIALTEKKENKSIEILKVFRNGAFSDASRFLEFADNFDPDSVLTKYNKAKIDILSKNRDRRNAGIESIIAISEPNEDDHTADLFWHKNNREMFMCSDQKMRQAISTQDGDKVAVIEAVLKKNADAAQKVIDTRSASKGGLWASQTASNRLSIASLCIGLAVTAYSSFDPAVAATVQDFLTHNYDLILRSIEGSAQDLCAPDGQIILTGDGGFASPVQQIAFQKALMGDGGFA